jgi:Chalcone isomerase-like
VAPWGRRSPGCWGASLLSAFSLETAARRCWRDPLLPQPREFSNLHALKSPEATMPKPMLLAVILVPLLFPAGSFAADLPHTLKVGEQELVLNGSGTREKYFLDMYVAGLYLAERNNQPASIIDADAPMAIRIAITSKLVSQEKLVESLNEGFENSTHGKIEPIRAQIEQFRQAFAAEITRGDVFDLVYLPEHGVTVFKNGKRTGGADGLPFNQALFGIWLGDKPADKTLKRGLLGDK